MRPLSGIITVLTKICDCVQSNGISVQLHTVTSVFCHVVRFFFGNWFGQGPKTTYRYSLTRDRISPVLDYCVIDYLFAQVKCKVFSNLYFKVVLHTRLHNLDNFMSVTYNKTSSSVYC